MFRTLTMLAAALVLVPTAVLADPPPAGKEPRTGPVLPRFGAVYTIETPDFPASPDRVYKVVFDVGQAPDDTAALNRGIETLARFLNMHARAGVPPENMKLALVLHGASARAALNDDAYRSRHGVANPDLPLLRDLREAGVDIYLCGQSASYRGIARNELAEPVRLALSAMTVLVTLQADGYQLIAF